MPRKCYSFAVRTSDIMEAIVAIRAMTFTQELGIAEFMLEGDLAVVINSLQSTEASLSPFGHLLESAKSTLVTSKCIAFSHVRRTSNRVAHNLVRHARHIRNLSVWVEDVPPNLYDVLFLIRLIFFFNTRSNPHSKKKKKKTSLILLRYYPKKVAMNGTKRGTVHHQTNLISFYIRFSLFFDRIALPLVPLFSLF